MAEGNLEILDEAACLQALRATAVGHLGFVRDGLPLVLPVNYRLVEVRGGREIFLRTHEGTAIDEAPREVALEIGGEDPVRRTGWSVLVQGSLTHVGPPTPRAQPFIDPVPWPEGPHDRWLALRLDRISGRRLRAPDQSWAFDVRAYL
jgi:hypothetical protein